VKVGLIQGPWFHALGYINEALDPLQKRNSFNQSSTKSKKPTNNSHLLRAPSDLGIARLELEVEESSNLGLQI
jgi:hypothetical protein